MIPSIAIYIDQNRPKADGTCSIKIKITFNRKRRYYSTGIYLSPVEFEQIFNGRRISIEQKNIRAKIEYFERKANDVIDGLRIFSFDGFENHYLKERNHHNTIKSAFEDYIRDLTEENRLGTASSYRCAMNSIESFSPNLTFTDITPAFLKSYERWMLRNGNSKTTVGIYLRALRTIINTQDLNIEFYPFGRGKGKYSIPTSANLKKALSVDLIAKIYNHPLEPGSRKEQARDYWIFLFLSNGLNVKDFCSLKWSQIRNNILTYQRAKTANNTRVQSSIQVALKEQSLQIIDKWGSKSRADNTYIFPHYSPEMSEPQKRSTHQQLTKTINKYMKIIADELGIEEAVTTNVARHSFATVLKRSGANTEMISDLLGHTSVRTTRNYLDSFEDEQIHSATDVLASVLDGK